MTEGGGVTDPERERERERERLHLSSPGADSGAARTSPGRSQRRNSVINTKKDKPMSQQRREQSPRQRSNDSHQSPASTSKQETERSRSKHMLRGCELKSGHTKDMKNNMAARMDAHTHIVLAKVLKVYRYPLPVGTKPGPALLHPWPRFRQGPHYCHLLLT